MLQTRPSSASGILQNASQSQSHKQYPANPQQMQRNNVRGMGNGKGISSNYRGHTTVAPTPTYAFTSTPSLAAPGQRQGPPLRADQRTSSAPSPMPLPTESGPVRSRYPAPPSVSTTTSSSSSSDVSALTHRSGSKDDSVITARVVSGAARPQSAVLGSGLVPNLALSAISPPSKPSPDRYRRPNNRRADSATSPQPISPPASSMPNVMQFYGSSTQAPTLPPASSQSFSLQMPQFSKPTTGVTSGATSVDDLQLKSTPSLDAAKRYRRRSIHAIDVGDYSGTPGELLKQGSRLSSSANGRIDQQHPLRSSPVVITQPAAHGRTFSSESVASTFSARGSSKPGSAAKRENPTSSPSAQSPAAIAVDQNTGKHDASRLVNIPPRASSTDAAKRIAPSPLSKPMTMSPEASGPKDTVATAVPAAVQPLTRPASAQVANGPPSPAAQQLAALNDKEGKKSKTSRLRRAFSFGSAADLRRASAENSQAISNTATVSRSQSRKDRYQEEHDEEQFRIAQQQEAGGIGSDIYSGQGHMFTGSTDNLSISSTASSASIMIRKMGKGMKKSTRSLVGLFRPKSVIGVPAADSALPQVSQAQVSMVNVEAEREKVNVNPDPHDQAGGGTGFPKLESNSIDAANATSSVTERLGSASTENSAARRSIVGGEKERAEVLAAVKKGILKRSGTDSGNSSPVIRPLDPKSTNFQLPNIPHVNDSPQSSAPSTPGDENGHKKNGSLSLGGEDYFMSALRFRGDSKSVPGTPQGAAAKRNATFSPRIQFHDTWPSGEYDRRGEIATCNRLTPMLAQQIKEEINNFKMEMVVHENSKIYTHFF
ncbi:uncharacterized protein L3040_007304 [Drepanopeziza brunnea f. sp. 'multigermtubi']|uniref:uncharacterized protein n=1 Tax=Drepanopeziza brunnea f. sp. 'multigermtubi' TaxID=698441 RepID=UPI0023A20924|nr:hypothetical protein L3040_007304 [Drepanopeziza brunnea f. sp. 'multigermtubi']